MDRRVQYKPIEADNKQVDYCFRVMLARNVDQRQIKTHNFITDEASARHSSDEFTQGISGVTDGVRTSPPPPFPYLLLSRFLADFRGGEARLLFVLEDIFRHMIILSGR